MINTTQLLDKTKYFIPKQFQRARLAQEVYTMVGRPSENDFKINLSIKMIKNCSITSQDMKIIQAIFDLGVASLQDRTTRKKVL